MAHAEDIGMKAYRKVRREMNARLVKADRAGRLSEELARIEREAMAWLRNGHDTHGKRA